MDTCEIYSQTLHEGSGRSLLAQGCHGRTPHSNA